MDSIAEYSAIMTNREQLYRFLGRLYRVEVDQALLDQMADLSFPEGCGEDELVDGYRMLENYLRRPGFNPVTDLAVDYAKVFLGAGVAKDCDAAYPYESVYTSPERLVMQDARDHVLATYRQKGLEKDAALDFPEDHIALELEFMACLCRETQNALTARDWPAVSTGLKEQKDFLAKHLLNWVPAFCDDIVEFASTDFYKAVARITSGYLAMEQAILEDMIAGPVGPEA
jgi:anaerobic sulfite reductase subunit A